jgi:hypothetical protein
MIEALQNLTSSRKAIIVVTVVIGVVVLAAIGRVPQEQAMDFMKWIVVAWLGAQAYEDGAVKAAAIQSTASGTASRTTMVKPNP